jgi:chaperonin GroES
MMIRPLHDRILVKRLEEETKTTGGLFIPDTAKEKPIQATVIAVGSGKRDKQGKLIALDVKPGDKVLFSKYSGSEVKIDGEEHLIMREDDLLAVSISRRGSFAKTLPQHALGPPSETRDAFSAGREGLQPDFQPSETIGLVT